MTGNCKIVTVEGRDSIQQDFNRLEKWSHFSPMRFNKVKCNVLHMSWGDPWYTDSEMDGWMEG